MKTRVFKILKIFSQLTLKDVIVRLGIIFVSIILIISFIPFVGQGFASGFKGFSGNSRNILVVDGVAVPNKLIINRLNLMLQELNAKGNLNQTSAMQSFNMVINNLVASYLFSSFARSFITMPSEKVVIDIITSNQEFQENGKFNKNKYLETIGKNFSSEQEYYDFVRFQYLKGLLLNNIYKVSLVPVFFDGLFDLYTKQTRVLQYKKIAIGDIKNFPKPSKKDLEKTREKFKGNFEVPETRKIQIAYLDKAKLPMPKVRNSEIQEYYKENKAKFTFGYQRSFMQVILESKTEAEELYKKLNGIEKNKQNLEKLGFRDIGFTSKEILPENLQSKAFSGKIGNIIGPIKTSLGWILLYSTGERESTTRKLLEVQEQIKEELLTKKMQDTMKIIQTEMSNAKGDLKFLEKVNSHIKVRNVTVNKIGQNEKGYPINDNVVANIRVLKIIFETKKGSNSKIFDTGKGIIGKARILNVQKAHMQEIKDIMLELNTLWEYSYKEEAIKKRAEKIIKDIEKDNKNVAKYDFKKTSLTSGNIEKDAKFNQNAKDILLQKKHSIKVYNNSDKSAYIVYVADIKNPDFKHTSKALQIDQNFQDLIVESLYMKLNKKYKVQTNFDLLRRE